MRADTITIADAQRDMRAGYFSGAPGMLVSGTVWLAAGAVAATGAPKHAIATLFVGGMLIHPLAVLLAKALGRRGGHDAANPLGKLAMESTVMLILGFPLAYAASLARLEWFFPAMLLVIGGRYMTFSTLFGRRIYWAVGLALAAAGWLLASGGAPFAWGGFTGGAIEIAFAAWIFASARGGSDA
jgi:hypothetical protein